MLLKITAIAATSALLLSGCGLFEQHASHAGHGTHWGYTGHEGPAHWGDLDPKFATCKLGETQSPINVTSVQSANLTPIAFDYKTSSMHILNNGHTVQVNFDAGSSMVLEGKTYNLVQVHFHTPSENHIQGESFPMEAHFVHQAADKSLAVIGVMIKEGQTNGFIEKVVNSLPKETTPATLVAGAQIKGTDFMPSNKAYYRFQGSLTTPPCSEGVSWVLLKTPMTASKAQLDALSQVLNHNNRPVQPTHGRAVRG